MSILFGDHVAVVLAGLGALAALGFGAFAVLSLVERERRAAAVSFGGAAGGAALAASAWALPPAVASALLLAIAAAAGVAVLVLLLPIGTVVRGDDEPRHRVDERDIMFARARLVAGSPAYEAYYARHPEHKAADDQIRTLPGLLSPAAGKAHPLHFASADASFAFCAALRESVDGPVAPTPLALPPPAMTSYVKATARYFGARSVGVTALRPYHLYTHVGRGSGTYGEPVVLDHGFAVAFTVEMDYAMIGTGPDAPAVMETARQYAEAARAAVQLAAFIRALGHPARAHIDGNYRVIAPLVARDAGLGEIGRMGLLMTPDLGPRVRLGVVTTNLPLVPDARPDDASVLDFCAVCRKCAENCPSRAIPFGDRENTDGVRRWRIDPIRCFRYWNVVGTDCGRCIGVCPYAHPDNVAHGVVRQVVRRSGAGRRAALWLDDLFYGRRPGPRAAPQWTAVGMPADGNSGRRPDVAASGNAGAGAGT